MLGNWRKVLQKGMQLAAVVLALGVIPHNTAEAEEDIFCSPYVTMAPDGKAWTTCGGESHNEHFEDGYTVDTGVESSLHPLDVGEHYYNYVRTGQIPVGKWEVNWENSACIHESITRTEYHGLTFRGSPCWQEYTQGWFAYCADCEQEVAIMLFYLCEDAAKSLTAIPTGMDYYYGCPHCNHLEQGAPVQSHSCRAVSANRYRITYRLNTNRVYYGFAPQDTFHMYNNATVYEGREVVADTRLAKMNVTVPGYTFVGWNTEADGSGIFYEAEAEIFNLTEYDSRYDEKGVVTLYAQWELSESTLLIDPAGGSYLGKSEVASYTKYAHETLELSPEEVHAPEGATLYFQVNGGEEISPMRTPQYFERWEVSGSLKGSLLGNTYTFPEENGAVDRLIAVYRQGEIVLPEGRKENVTFGGWYYNAECTHPAGNAGERIVIEEDTTLYARWVVLKLDSAENGVANGGRGAVDLWWSQPDTYRKSYSVYRYTSQGVGDIPVMDSGEWTFVSSALEESDGLQVQEDFLFSGASHTYTIPYTGWYTLAAAGAQGGGFATYAGGLGGGVQAVSWLEAGDVLTYTVGGQNGYNSGGRAQDYGNGGGATVVESANKGVLLVAAGGGGATKISNGGNGGESISANLVAAGYAGEDGMAGGGGGYRGGRAGEYSYHEHTQEDCGYHTHQGNTVTGGACYTTWQKQGICRPIQHALADEVAWICGTCGGTVIQQHYYAGGDCGDAVSGRVDHDYYDIWCEGSCGYSESYGLASHVYTYRIHEFTCNVQEGYQCGKSDSIPENVKAAYGGSSYVNTDDCKQYHYNHGSNAGDGYFRISSQKVGYVNALQMTGVPAPDLAAPKAVSAETVQMEPLAGGDKIFVSWECPEDGGTDYYFQVVSHDTGTGEQLAYSNIRKHTLTTGVRGYYYVVNTEQECGSYEEIVLFTEENGVEILLKEEEQFLHIMSADGAGNRGGILTISLGSLSRGSEGTQVVPWPVFTGQMDIAMGEGISPAGEAGTYYVRCDDTIPVELEFETYLEGPASAGYQITRMYFCTQQDDTEGAIRITVPLREMSGGDVTMGREALGLTVEGITALKPNSYITVRSSEQNRILSVKNTFLLGADAEGKKIAVTPGAAVLTEKYNVASDKEQDSLHGIYLIGDATAPIVQGMDLWSGEQVWRGTENAVLQLTASDTLSGLESFRVEIYNTENGSYAWYEGDEAGRITLNRKEDTTLFAGEFVMTLVAVDKVGNRLYDIFHVTGMGLETKVERILAPHEPVFKRGESGILSIETWGYLERVVVEFPEYLAAYNSTFEYHSAQYQTGESIQFMIPLYDVEDGILEITVWAYKGLESLVEKQQIVIAGTVLEELRTRLR